MKNRNPSPIQKRLVKIIFFTSFIVTVLGYSLFIFHSMSHAHEENIKLSEALSNALSQNFAKLILLDNVNEASNITSMLHSFPKIKALTLYNTKHKAIYAYRKKDFDSDTEETLPFTSLSHTVSYQGNMLGEISFDINSETIGDFFLKNLPILLYSLFGLFLLSYLLAKYYARLFSQPILSLVKFLQNIDLAHTQKQYLSSAHINDEFSIIYHAVNQMLHKIEEANHELKIASVAFEIERAIIITDEKFHILKVNKSYCDITGFEQKDVEGKRVPVLEGLSEHTQYHIIQTLKEVFKWSGELKNRKKDGSTFLEYLSIHTVLDENQHIIHYIFSFYDITKQRETEEQLQYLLSYDTVTGLPNRQLVHTLFETSFIPHRSAVLCYDIRYFSEINKAYGYEAGDQILREVTERIKNSFDFMVTAGKLLNNTFLLAFSYPHSDRNTVAELCQFDIEYLFSLFSIPFLYKTHKIYLDISVGAAFTEDGENAKALIYHAESALLQAKKEERKLLFFNKDIQNKAHTVIDIYAQILHALEHQEFELYYQLQYNELRIPYAAEALIRWHHPQKGILPPSIFIPIAEKTGLISKIGHYVIEQVCIQLKAWKNNPKTKYLQIAVNIGAKHFKEEDFVKRIKKTILSYNIDPTLIKLELTEYTLLEDIQIVEEKMLQLKSLGIQISLDDFGTGFSSLQYLRELPIDQIKIDQSFIRSILDNPKDIALVKSILTFAHTLQLEVIAEGVEEEAHFMLLQELGCHYFQGYYFAKPENIREVERLLHVT